MYLLSSFFVFKTFTLYGLDCFRVYHCPRQIIREVKMQGRISSERYKYDNVRQTK